MALTVADSDVLNDYLNDVNPSADRVAGLRVESP